MLDLHNHILPHMDDGCKTPEESVQALQLAARQGVEVVFATPHYYPVESSDAFLQRRRTAVAQLEEYLRRKPCGPLPQLCLGAEVAYRAGIGNDPNLPALCLGGTDHLLLELPFHSWGAEIFRQIRSISANQGITVVLAHLERYVGIVPMAQLRQLLEMDVMVQVNAGSFLTLAQRRAVKKLMRFSRIDFLGSDCHNLTSRPPVMGPAREYLQKKRKSFILDYAQDQAQTLFSQVKEDYLLTLTQE